jgi:hypothetical protein
MLVLLMGVCCLAYGQTPSAFSFPVKVTLNATTGIVAFNWDPNETATKYVIKRKIVDNINAIHANIGFESIDSITNNTTTAKEYIDTIVGKDFYEYQIEGYYTVAPLKRNTFLCVGNRVEHPFDKGTILLLIDNTISDSLTKELQIFRQDLIGDGWHVKELFVNRSNNPIDVKAVKENIQQFTRQYTDISQIVIIGHVPVPYSGLIYPDGHTEHFGAWPADSYYGDLEGVYTDTSINNTFASRPENRNLIGDGKFDQSFYKQVNIAVGRIDFYNLPVFAETEIALYKRYFDKNHLYRIGATEVQKAALIEDNLSSFAEKFSQSAWKSFTSIVGKERIKEGQYDTDLLNNAGYLWSFGCGGGTYSSANGIVTSSNFATLKFYSVFTQLFGSYFGDWDNQNNLLRSAIAGQGNTLTSVWGGRPHWYFHHMGAGFPIGYSALITLNNKTNYTNFGYGNTMVHTALMGDPSVRSIYIKPVNKVIAAINGRKIEVSWTPSSQRDILGYRIYKSNTINGNYILLSNQLLSDTSFIDTLPYTGNNVYMVRVVKEEMLLQNSVHSNNSSYLNYSTGQFDSTQFYNIVLPIQFTSITGKSNNCMNTIQWNYTATNADLQFYLECKPVGFSNFYVVDSISTKHLPNNTGLFQLHHHFTGTNSAYRVKAVEASGNVVYSNTINISSNCTNQTIKTYPSPVTKQLFVEIPPNYTGQNNLVIVDLTGKKIHQQQVNIGSNQVNMTSYLPGSYCLLIQNARHLPMFIKVQKF